jgi:hypothetical protein
MTIRIVTIIALVQVLLCGLCVLFFPIEPKSFGFGGLLSLLNFSILAYLWHNIIYKKRVARALIIVVIKYGILVYIFSQLSRWPWVNLNHLVAGILINPLALVLGGFIEKKLRKNAG